MSLSFVFVIEVMKIKTAMSNLLSLMMETMTEISNSYNFKLSWSKGKYYWVEPFCCAVYKTLWGACRNKHDSIFRKKDNNIRAETGQGRNNTSKMRSGNSSCSWLGNSCTCRSSENDPSSSNAGVEAAPLAILGHVETAEETAATPIISCKSRNLFRG